MNILESQVTDLNYLADSPLSLSAGGMNGHRQSSSAESPGTANVNGSGNKRRADESNSNNSAPHTRAKRNRYISIAW
jgi:hypothetical protein